MTVDDGPLRDVNGWDDWLHRACPPNILDIANRALVAWANCEYPLRFPPSMLIQFGVALSSLSFHCMHFWGWRLEPPPACSDLAREYIEAFLLNWEDDDRFRMKRVTFYGRPNNPFPACMALFCRNVL